MINQKLEKTLLEQGFVKFPKVFSSEEIDELRLKSEAVLYRTSDEHRERYRSNGSLCNLAELPEYASLIADKRIFDCISKVGGRDIRWASGYLISKPPGGAPLFWHQDWWAWDNECSYDVQPLQLFVMIYLTDTRVENGCLRVIPKSHTSSHELHKLPAAHTKVMATDIDKDSSVYRTHPDELALPVKAGDLLIGDARLLHSAYANLSDEERPLLTLWYIPNFHQLPEELRGTIRDVYERTVVDIDDNKEALATCDSWPKYAYDKINHLIPDVDSGTGLAELKRIPDQTRMRQGGEN